MLWFLFYCWLFLFILNNSRNEVKKEDITDPDIDDSYNIAIGDSDISNSDIGNTDISNSDIGNTDIESNVE